MLRSIEGIYRDGKIEFVETPPQQAPARVVVTFLDAPAPVDLEAHGIDRAHSAELRARLSAIAEDWSRPEMDVYDDL